MKKQNDEKTRKRNIKAKKKMERDQHRRRQRATSEVEEKSSKEEDDDDDEEGEEEEGPNPMTGWTPWPGRRRKRSISGEASPRGSQGWPVLRRRKRGI